MLGMLTWNRSAVFEDAETLYRDVIARNPQAWMAYQNLGTELASRNRLSEAIDAYEGALRARPDFPQARNNLVLAHMKLGDAAADVPDRIPSSIWHYESVLRIQPDHFRAHYNLGTVLMDLPERHAEAITHLESSRRRFNQRARKPASIWASCSPTFPRVRARLSNIWKSHWRRDRI